MGANVRRKKEIFAAPVVFNALVEFGAASGLDLGDVVQEFSVAVVAAAGSGQSTFAALTKQLNAITGADGTKGVALPAAAAGKPICIINTDASNTLVVAPVNGGNDAINGLTAGTGTFTMGPGRTAWFIPTSATQWYVAALAAVTSTPAELNLLDGQIANVTFAAAAGAANVMVVTCTLKDAAGATLAARRRVEFYITEDANGVGLTADTISGDATWGANQEVEEIVSKKRFTVLTGSDGIATLSIEDSAKPTDQRVAAVLPMSGALIVSSALNAWGS